MLSNILSTVLRKTAPTTATQTTLTAKKLITSNSLASAANPILTANKALATQLTHAITMRAPHAQARLDTVLTQPALNTKETDQPKDLKKPQSQTLSQTTFTEATRHLKAPDSKSPHPLYAVPSIQVNNKHMPVDSPRLFNLKMQISPFKKALDTVQALALTRFDSSGLTVDILAEKKRTSILEKLNSIFNTVSTPEEKNELLNILEYQLLGPQAEIGSGKTITPECIAQLHYDCHQILASHGMSFSDLDALIGALQSQRGHGGNAQIKQCANAAAQSPWPAEPKNKDVHYEDFEMQNMLERYI